jgi:hypothetical protein
MSAAKQTERGTNTTTCGVTAHDRIFVAHPFGRMRADHSGLQVVTSSADVQFPLSVEVAPKLP